MNRQYPLRFSNPLRCPCLSKMMKRPDAPAVLTAPRREACQRPICLFHCSIHSGECPETCSNSTQIDLSLVATRGATRGSYFTLRFDAAYCIALTKQLWPSADASSFRNCKPSGEPFLTFCAMFGNATEPGDGLMKPISGLFASCSAQARPS